MYLFHVLMTLILITELVITLIKYTKKGSKDETYEVYLLNLGYSYLVAYFQLIISTIKQILELKSLFFLVLE